MMKSAGSKNLNPKEHQFWQQHNKPIELWSNEVIDQKVDYNYKTPVEVGCVHEPKHWQYSSAYDYFGNKGSINVEILYL